MIAMLSVYANGDRFVRGTKSLLDVDVEALCIRETEFLKQGLVSSVEQGSPKHCIVVLGCRYRTSDARIIRDKKNRIACTAALTPDR
jgi:hypothetical protein